MKKCIGAGFVGRISLACFLVCCIMLSCFPIMAYAEAETWAQVGNTSWYDPVNPVTHYDINTAEELAGLALLVNEDDVDFDGVSFYLTNDIDLSGREWVPIGRGEVTAGGQIFSTFNGQFYGNGHTISGISVLAVHAVMPEAAGYLMGFSGLFGILEPDGLIDGVVLEGEINVTRANNPKLSDGYSGGIVGYNFGTVSNCVNRASVSGHYATGGITGFTSGTTSGTIGYIIKCANEGSISGGYKVGGISGGMETGIIEEASNIGAVSGSATTTHLGGVLGNCSDGFNVISICYNWGTIAVDNSRSAYYIGGIAGALYYDVELSGCYNAGLLKINRTGTFYAGAFVGDFGHNQATVTSIKNSYYLDASYEQAYGRISASAATEDFDSKTQAEMESAEFLELLNRDGVYWASPVGGGYPVLAYTQSAAPADYSDVTTAISEIPSDYPGAYTSATESALKGAVDSVVYGKTADEQDIVDGYAAAIRAAISGLRRPDDGGSVTYSYTVSFQTNGGMPIESVRVYEGRTLPEPDAPTKGVYIFDGWYSDDTLKTPYDFTKPVNHSFTLHAKWRLPEPERFEDVPDSHWAWEYISWMNRRGYMQGTGGGMFSPGEPTQRAMAVTVLWRTASEPEGGVTAFTDIPEDAYFSGSVSWAAANKIVLGYTETQFSPYENITREQLAAILFRFAAFEGRNTSASADISAYSDSGEISAYALDAVQWAVAEGLIVGRSGSILAPREMCTRAELATMMYRYLNLPQELHRIIRIQPVIMTAERDFAE